MAEILFSPCFENVKTCASTIAAIASPFHAYVRGIKFFIVIAYTTIKPAPGDRITVQRQT